MKVKEWDKEIAVPEIQMTREEIKEKLREYEECYQLSSEQFHWQWKQGKAPDIPESVAWAIFYEYLQNGYGLDPSDEERAH